MITLILIRRMKISELSFKRLQYPSNLAKDLNAGRSCGVAVWDQIGGDAFSRETAPTLRRG